MTESCYDKDNYCIKSTTEDYNEKNNGRTNYVTSLLSSSSYLPLVNDHHNDVTMMTSSSTLLRADNANENTITSKLRQHDYNQYNDEIEASSINDEKVINVIDDDTLKNDLDTMHFSKTTVEYQNSPSLLPKNYFTTTTTINSGKLEKFNKPDDIHTVTGGKRKSDFDNVTINRHDSKKSHITLATATTNKICNNKRINSFSQNGININSDNNNYRSAESDNCKLDVLQSLKSSTTENLNEDAESSVQNCITNFRNSIVNYNNKNIGHNDNISTTHLTNQQNIFNQHSITREQQSFLVKNNNNVHRHYESSCNATHKKQKDNGNTTAALSNAIFLPESHNSSRGQEIYSSSHSTNSTESSVSMDGLTIRDGYIGDIDYSTSGSSSISSSPYPDEVASHHRPSLRKAPIISSNPPKKILSPKTSFDVTATAEISPLYRQKPIIKRKKLNVNLRRHGDVSITGNSRCTKDNGDGRNSTIKNDNKNDDLTMIHFTRRGIINLGADFGYSSSSVSSLNCEEGLPSSSNKSHDDKPPGSNSNSAARNGNDGEKSTSQKQIALSSQQEQVIEMSSITANNITKVSSPRRASECGSGSADVIMMGSMNRSDINCVNEQTPGSLSTEQPLNVRSLSSVCNNDENISRKRDTSHDNMIKLISNGNKDEKNLPPYATLLPPLHTVYNPGHVDTSHWWDQWTLRRGFGRRLRRNWRGHYNTNRAALHHPNNNSLNNNSNRFRRRQHTGDNNDGDYELGIHRTSPTQSSSSSLSFFRRTFIGSWLYRTFGDRRRYVNRRRRPDSMLVIPGLDNQQGEIPTVRQISIRRMEDSGSSIANRQGQNLFASNDNTESTGNDDALSHSRGNPSSVANTVTTHHECVANVRDPMRSITGGVHPTTVVSSIAPATDSSSGGAYAHHRTLSHPNFADLPLQYDALDGTINGLRRGAENPRRHGNYRLRRYTAEQEGRDYRGGRRVRGEQERGNNDDGDDNSSDNDGNNGEIGNILSKVCSSSCCFSCLTVLTSFRWVLISLALLGVCCVITGIILVALHKLAHSFLTLSLMFIGLGLLMVIVVIIGWRVTPMGHEPCHLIFNLGFYSRYGGYSSSRRNHHSPNFINDNATSSAYRRFRSGGLYGLYGANWYSGLLPPEFHYPPPPPSYATVMEEQKNAAAVIRNLFPATTVSSSAIRTSCNDNINTAAVSMTTVINADVTTTTSATAINSSNYGTRVIAAITGTMTTTTATHLSSSDGGVVTCPSSVDSRGDEGFPFPHSERRGRPLLMRDNGNLLLNPDSLIPLQIPIRTPNTPPPSYRPTRCDTAAGDTNRPIIFLDENSLPHHRHYDSSRRCHRNCNNMNGDNDGFSSSSTSNSSHYRHPPSYSHVIQMETRKRDNRRHDDDDINNNDNPNQNRINVVPGSSNGNIIINIDNDGGIATAAQAAINDGVCGIKVLGKRRNDFDSTVGKATHQVMIHRRQDSSVRSSSVTTSEENNSSSSSSSSTTFSSLSKNNNNDNDSDEKPPRRQQIGEGSLLPGALIPTMTTSMMITSDVQQQQRSSRSKSVTSSSHNNYVRRIIGKMDADVGQTNTRTSSTATVIRHYSSLKNLSLYHNYNGKSKRGAINNISTGVAKKNKTLNNRQNITIINNNNNIDDTCNDIIYDRKKRKNDRSSSNSKVNNNIISTDGTNYNDDYLERNNDETNISHQAAFHNRELKEIDAVERDVLMQHGDDVQADQMVPSSFSLLTASTSHLFHSISTAHSLPFTDIITSMSTSTATSDVNKYDKQRNDAIFLNSSSTKYYGAAIENGGYVDDDEENEEKSEEKDTAINESSGDDVVVSSSIIHGDIQMINNISSKRRMISTKNDDKKDSVVISERTDDVIIHDNNMSISASSSSLSRDQHQVITSLSDDKPSLPVNSLRDALRLSRSSNCNPVGNSSLFLSQQGRQYNHHIVASSRKDYFV